MSLTGSKPDNVQVVINQAVIACEGMDREEIMDFIFELTLAVQPLLNQRNDGSVRKPQLNLLTKEMGQG